MAGDMFVTRDPLERADKLSEAHEIWTASLAVPSG